MSEHRNSLLLFIAGGIIALAVIGAGNVVGHETHLAPYGTVASKPVNHYVAGTQANGYTGYLQLKGDSAVYVVPETGVTPEFSAKALGKTSNVALTILPTSTGLVDIKGGHGVELKGFAYQVLALAVTTGKRTTTYATAQYMRSPQGYQVDQVAMGGEIIGGGIVALVLFAAVLGLFIFSKIVIGFFEVAGFDTPSPWELALGLLGGVAFLAFNFPAIVSNIGQRVGVPMVRDLGTTARAQLFHAFGALPGQQIVSFHNLWSGFLIGVGVYLGALALLSLRHWRLDLFGLGVAALVVGAASLHVLAWAGAVLWWLLGVVAAILGWLFGVLALVLGWLFSVIGAVIGWLTQVIGAFLGFLGELIGRLIALILQYSVWAVLLLLLLAGLIYLAVRYRHVVLEILQAVARTLLIAALLAGAGFLLLKLGQLLLPVLIAFFDLLGRLFAALIHLLAPLLSFLASMTGLLIRVLFYVFVALIVGWIVYGLGAFLLDQVKGGWNSGNGRRGVILGSLAIGTAVSLILMETNLYGAVSYFPGAVANLILTNLHQSTPIVDVLFAFLVLAISILGLLRNVPRLLQEPGLAQFRTALVMCGVGLIVGVVFVALAAYAQSQSST